MTLDDLATGLILLAGFFALFLIGKLVNDLLHREYKLNYELTTRDNSALALAMAGYYLGLVMAIGGSLAGPSQGLVNDLIDLAVYGPLAIVLLNISWYICDKLILFGFKISDELIRDQNQGAGAVSAGMSVANGFIIFGSLQGEGGGLVTAVVFWALGQVVLILAGLVYNLITPYSVLEQIEKDNQAAGVSFGGALAGVGGVIGLAAQVDFVSWEQSLFEYLAFAALGLVLLPVVRTLADNILLPGVKLSDEIAGQEKPNLGAAYIEAMSYVAAAFIVYWCV
jgi:uncharacterized membrane protein YjfL (UPF0719 family)